MGGFSTEPFSVISQFKKSLWILTNQQSFAMVVKGEHNKPTGKSFCFSFEFLPSSTQKRYQFSNQILLELVWCGNRTNKLAISSHTYPLLKCYNLPRTKIVIMISEYLETGLEFVHIVKKCHFRSKPRTVVLQKTGAPNDSFRKHICSEDDLRSRIFGTFVAKFLACLPLLGFSNI